MGVPYEASEDERADELMETTIQAGVPAGDSIANAKQPAQHAAEKAMRLLQHRVVLRRIDVTQSTVSRFLIACVPAAAGAQPGQYAGQLLGVEPGAVLAADIDDDAAVMSVIEAIHLFAAHGAWAIEQQVAVRFRCHRRSRQAKLGGYLLRRFRHRAGRQGFPLGPPDQLTKRFVPHPESRTSTAFQHRDVRRSESSAGQNMAVLTRRAQQRGVGSGVEFGDQPGAAVMAE